MEPDDNCRLPFYECLQFLAHFTTELVKDIPQQENGSDCGMFTCKFAEYLSRDADISFSQDDMPYFRKRMVYEIVRADLMHP